MLISIYSFHSYYLHDNYPSNYYSFSDDERPSSLYLVRKIRTKFSISKNPFTRCLTNMLTGRTEISRWLGMTDAHQDSRIIDIGCGSGKLLKQLHQLGFRDLTGVDPYAKQEIKKQSLKILKCSIQDINNEYDVVMLHHSFEHMPDQLQILKRIAKITNERGKILIRVPVANSWAERHYKENWVQIDAPRHVGIPSKQGMSEIARLSNLRLSGIHFDSHELQFYGSKLYKSGISLRSPNAKNSFSMLQKLSYKIGSKFLNLFGRGDAACFILTPNRSKI